MPALPRLPVPAEHRILKWACELSPRTQRRLFGAPPTIDGQTLAGDIQALIRIAELAESNSFLVGMGIEEARGRGPARGGGAAPAPAGGRAPRPPAADPDGRGEVGRDSRPGRPDPRAPLYARQPARWRPGLPAPLLPPRRLGDPRSPHPSPPL